MVYVHVHTQTCTQGEHQLCTCITMPHLMIDVVDLTGLQIIILAEFVMISSGVVLHLYSLVITLNRLGTSVSVLGQSQGILSALYAMFAGMLLKNLFLVSLKMYVPYCTQYVCTVHTHLHTHMYCMHNL